MCACPIQSNIKSDCMYAETIFIYTRLYETFDIRTMCIWDIKYTDKSKLPALNTCYVMCIYRFYMCMRMCMCRCAVANVAFSVCWRRCCCSSGRCYPYSPLLASLCGALLYIYIYVNASYIRAHIHYIHTHTWSTANNVRICTHIYMCVCVLRVVCVWV